MVPMGLTDMLHKRGLRKWLMVIVFNPDRVSDGFEVDTVVVLQVGVVNIPVPPLPE